MTETVIAMLILMISVTAGLVIYGRLAGTGVNDQALRAGLYTDLVTDSLAAADSFQDQVIQQNGFTVAVKFSEVVRFKGAWVLAAVCRDSEGKILAEVSKIVTGDGKQD